MVSDEQLLEDLREFADELGETPTAAQMNNSGPWDSSTYSGYFGSWNGALKNAGLEINEEKGVSKGQLLEELREFASELGETPTQKEMNKRGPRYKDIYQDHFGSWNNALKAAGLEINKERGMSKGQLLEDLREFASELGKTPAAKQMKNNGPHPPITYQDRFGSWNNALEAAGLEINSLGTAERAGIGEKAYGEGYAEARREVIYRDDYQCRACGTEKHLNCHHIKPRRTFNDVSESNTVDNLITLCASCHGTFEGRWQDAAPDEFAENAKEVLS